MQHQGWSNASMQFANSQAAQRSIMSPEPQRLRNDSGVSTHACQHHIHSTCTAAPYPATIPAPAESLQMPQQHAYHRATQVRATKVDMPQVKCCARLYCSIRLLL